MKNKLNNFLGYLHIVKGFSQGTIEAYQLDIERGLIPFLTQHGKLEIEDVSKDDIRAYMDFLTIVRGNSVVTRARKLSAIKSLFNYCVENEGLKANPASSLSSPKIPEREPIYLTEEECHRLLQSIARMASPKVRDRNMAMILFFLHTGLRVSELTNLKLVDVDLEGDQIKITRKGNKEQYLHLNSETVNALEKYLVNRPKTQNGNCIGKIVVYIVLEVNKFPCQD